MLRIRLIEDRPALAAVGPHWARLQARQEHPWPFLDWTWFDTFWSEMDLDRRRVVIVTAWDGDELVGAAPLAIGAGRVAGLECRVVAGLENVHSPSFNWLVPDDADGTEAVVRAMAEAVRALAPGRRVLRWGNAYAADRGTLVARRGLADAGYRIVLRAARRPFTIRLPEGSPFFGTLSARMRKRLNNGWSRLARRGGARFEEVSAAANLREHLERAWSLEASTWKGAAGGAVLRDARIHRFYNSLAERWAPVRKMALFTLSCGETLVAFAYTALDEATVHGLKLTFNSDFADMSPAYLLVWRIIEWAQQHGLRAFNLGGHEAEWKAHWSREQSEVVTLYAFPRDAAGTFMYMSRFGWRVALEKIPGFSEVERRRVAWRGQRARAARDKGAAAADGAVRGGEE